MSETEPTTDGPLVITGAAGGIGRAVAELAVGGGAPVALLDLDEERLASVADELADIAPDPDVVTIGCDVTDEDGVEAAFDAAEALGPPAGIVTAAGIDRGAPIDELDPSIWDEVLAVNLRGTFLACRAGLRRMLAAEAGSIVCVSSPLAFVATRASGAYGASKGGVSALVRSLAVDYAPRGIRVNALLPGPTESALMWARVPDADVAGVRETIRDEVPLGRLADPAEVARAALWLLSPAASYVTGAQLPCDGGVLAKASVSV